MLKILMIGKWLEPFQGSLHDLIQTPNEVAIVPNFLDDDVCRELPGVEIAITSHWWEPMGRTAKDLKFIQLPGAGWDKIDPAAIPPGVLVANCYEHEWGMAEYVLMQCLVLSRQLLAADASIRQDDWAMYPNLGHAPYPELGGRTIGIIGLGRIGRAVAALAGASRMRRIGIDVVSVPPAVQAELGLEFVGGPADLPHVLATSDFVVLATPLATDKAPLLGAKELALLKPSAFLLNPARAELIDERALYETLRDRRIAGAALDPWWHYPRDRERVAPSEFPFRDLTNVVMTPHISSYTDGTVERRFRVVAANIDRYARGEPVVNVVRELSRAG